jgi:hypothetical protein
MTHINYKNLKIGVLINILLYFIHVGHVDFVFCKFDQILWYFAVGTAQANTNPLAPCSLGLSATRQQYFSLRTN